MCEVVFVKSASKDTAGSLLMVCEYAFVVEEYAEPVIVTFDARSVNGVDGVQH